MVNWYLTDYLGRRQYLCNKAQWSRHPTDDGNNRRASNPTPRRPADADKNWNALSLPFVVGPNGRIGKVRDDASNHDSAQRNTAR